MTITTQPVVRRTWRDFAPKIVAFFATGLTSTGLVALLNVVGVAIDPGFAGLIVGVLSFIAAYITRDNLLVLAPRQIAAKVTYAGLTAVTATGIIAFASYLGASLDPALAGLIVTVLATVAGYFKSDDTL